MLTTQVCTNLDIVRCSGKPPLVLRTSSQLIDFVELAEVLEPPDPLITNSSDWRLLGSPLTIISNLEARRVPQSAVSAPALSVTTMPVTCQWGRGVLTLAYAPHVQDQPQ